MKFDINRVYTAVNADELKPGSKVFGADDLGSLRRIVEGNAEPDTLEAVNSDSYGFRFDIDDVDYMLAYLVSEPKKPRRMTNHELAKWLAQGNSQCMFTTNSVGIAYSYGMFDDHEIPEYLRV